MASNREENVNPNIQNCAPEFAVPKPPVSLYKVEEEKLKSNSQLPSNQSNDVLKVEEEKLKVKYQLPSTWRGSGHSAFLQKKLAKGQKFFDSGDYQMAKQNTGVNRIDKAVPQPLLKFGTGEAIPTPDTVPARKTSIIQPKFTPAT